MRAEITRVIGTVVYVSAIALGSGVAWAQALQKGATLEATDMVKLREAPPAQKLGIFVDSPGKETHTLAAGTQVKVEAVDKVKVPFDEHTWVKVKTLSGKEGWAYYGSDGDKANFKLK